MAQQTFPQAMNKTDNGQGPTNVSIGQTRDGKDEWITPITMWERQLSSGLYLPPGAIEDHTDVGKPRVKADEIELLLEQIRDKDITLTEVENLLTNLTQKDYSTEVTLQEVLTELANVKAELQAVKDNQTNGTQKVDIDNVTLDTSQSTIEVPAEVNQGSPGTEPWLVQQSGSIVSVVDPDDGTISEVNQQIFEGVSTDTKPTDGINLYDKFYENDTGDIYYWDKNGWVLS